MVKDVTVVTGGIIGHKRFSIPIAWIPGHVGICANERADELISKTNGTG